MQGTLEGGQAVKIEGGFEADRLRDVLRDVENADVIGEFAFGTSMKFGSPSEKRPPGTSRLALADNHKAYPGGKNDSTPHLDGVCLNLTLQILETGQHILIDSRWAL